MADKTTPPSPTPPCTQLPNPKTHSHTTPIVTTPRLIIRPMCTSDAPSMSHNANNPLVAKYMSLAFPDPYTLSSAETWIHTNTALPHQDHFVICELASPDIVIGGIGVKPGADVHAHTAEVGFWIGEAYWGRGYTTEVLEGFTRWSFERWEKDGRRLRKVWGGVFGGNVASMRCFDKCGYAVEGVMKGHCEKRGEVMDLHVFGLTKLDWEKRVGHGLE